ncbi:hypothetical protein [Variovorax sp. PAMC26660]|uniref:hypothetical protein n=1 Tax=Variovorax sp. PAMC26660 TaxID=2762322 RepID=UPI0021C30F36|nr:hypothetical protein [Variovorax sp. PAMC26660]
MCRFRAFLLWAVMLAIPFQGFAAVSQAFCAPAPAPTQAQAVHVASSSHDHVAPDGDTAHKCGTCGACQAAALMPSASVMAFPHLPAADLVELHSAMQAIAPRVLEKPPRA